MEGKEEGKGDCDLVMLNAGWYPVGERGNGCYSTQGTAVDGQLRD